MNLLEGLGAFGGSQDINKTVADLAHTTQLAVKAFDEMIEYCKQAESRMDSDQLKNLRDKAVRMKQQAESMQISIQQLKGQVDRLSQDIQTMIENCGTDGFGPNSSYQQALMTIKTKIDELRLTLGH